MWEQRVRMLKSASYACRSKSVYLSGMKNYMTIVLRPFNPLSFYSVSKCTVTDIYSKYLYPTVCKAEFSKTWLFVSQVKM